MYCGITSGKCNALKIFLSRYAEKLSYKFPAHIPSSSLVTCSDDQEYDNTTTHSPTDSVMSNRLQAAILDTPSTTTPAMSHWLGNPLPSSSLLTSSSTALSSSETSVLFSNTTEKIYVPSKQGVISDQKIFNTLTITQDILKHPVNVLYLFQCFQEAQDDKLCEIFCESFDNCKIDLSYHKLLPHQVVSLGFFLSRSHRKWNKLCLSECHIKDHGINLLHHYLCGDKTNKQEITTIDLNYNFLTVASSPLISEIITNLQPHTVRLGNNNITSMRDISTAVIYTNTVKVLNMWHNGLTAQEASAISDMITCLEELYISYNKLGDDGAVIISERIAETNTLRKLSIDSIDIATTGTTAIANGLLHNTSLEVLHMNHNAIGEGGAVTIAKAIANNKTLKYLDIDSCKIKSTGTTAIANSLLHNTSLEGLNMARNAIGKDGATAIAQAISKNRTLKLLNLTKCDLACMEVIAIANGLLHNTSLVELNLCYSIFGHHAATAIAQAITNNKTLKKLLLFGTLWTIGEDTAIIILRSLRCNNSITLLLLMPSDKCN